MNTNEISQIAQTAQTFGFSISTAQLAMIAAIVHYALIQIRAFVGWWNQSGGRVGILAKFNYGNTPPKP